MAGDARSYGFRYQNRSTTKDVTVAERCDDIVAVRCCGGRGGAVRCDDAVAVAGGGCNCSVRWWWGDLAFAREEKG
nr:hypothetical protein Iba_chr02aCG8180 [Ipomoea batatas]